MADQKGQFRREPPSELVSLDSLKIDPTKILDANLVSMYSKWLEGKSDSVFTRVPLDDIAPGVFLPTEDGRFEVPDQNFGSEHVDTVAVSIRRGLRPPLLLYKSRPGQTDKRFVCSDDVVTFHAYNGLGIREVPAQIVGPYEFNDLTRSGYLVRNASKKKAGTFGLIHVEPKLVATILGNRIEGATFENVLRELIQAAQQSCKAIEAFDLSGSEIVHYHNTLHAAAFRCLEALRAVELLWREGMLRQAYPLVRSLYEMMLNFSLDWLAPDRLGAMLHAYAELRRGLTPEKFAALKKTVRPPGGYIFHLFENVAEKAKASPLGLTVHRTMYAELSAETHQDYAVTAAYANTINGEPPLPLSSTEREVLLRQLDLIVAATLRCVMDDVGNDAAVAS